MSAGPMALLAAMALTASAANGQIPLAGEDLQGRKVEGQELRGKVVLVAVATDETSDAVIDWQVRLGYEASVTLGGGDGVIVVSVADVSDYPWIARPFVRRRLAAIDRAARERLRDLFGAERREPPPAFQDGVRLVPDWSGAISRALVPLAERRRPHFFLVDRSGVIRGHFTENGDATRREAAALLASLVAAGATAAAETR